MLFNLFLSSESTSASDSTSNTGMIIIMAVMVVAIIGLFVWQSISNKKKRKEAENMVNQLKKGDRVKTIGGICGFVAEINDAENTFVLETGLEANKSYIKFDKAAIYQTAPHDGSLKGEEKKEEKVEEPKVEEPKVEEVKEETSKKKVDRDDISL